MYWQLAITGLVPIFHSTAVFTSCKENLTTSRPQVASFPGLNFQASFPGFIPRLHSQASFPGLIPRPAPQLLSLAIQTAVCGGGTWERGCSLEPGNVAEVASPGDTQDSIPKNCGNVIFLIISSHNTLCMSICRLGACGLRSLHSRGYVWQQRSNGAHRHIKTTPGEVLKGEWDGRPTACQAMHRVSL